MSKAFFQQKIHLTKEENPGELLIIDDLKCGHHTIVEMKNAKEMLIHSLFTSAHQLCSICSLNGIFTSIAARNTKILRTFRV